MDLATARDLARKAFLDVKAQERADKAARARTRRTTAFRPGDAVMIWRSGKGLHDRATGTEKVKNARGQMYGVARVLATEIALDEDGRHPRAIVWCVRVCLCTADT